jgi:hypothetical protein
MVDELISGTCIAIEIRGHDAHRAFREFAGPHDPVSHTILKTIQSFRVFEVDSW